MEISQKHLRDNCDPRLSGMLSLSIKEAYRFLDDLILREKVFQRPEMNKVKGYVRHGLVDVGLKQVLQSSSISHEIADKSSSRYSNGHTYYESGKTIPKAESLLKILSVLNFPRSFFQMKFQNLLQELLFSEVKLHRLNVLETCKKKD